MTRAVIAIPIVGDKEKSRFKAMSTDELRDNLLVYRELKNYIVASYISRLLVMRNRDARLNAELQSRRNEPTVSFEDVVKGLGLERVGE